MKTNDPHLTKTPIDSAEVAPSRAANDKELQANTQITNGTETLDSEIVDSQHVNDGDNPARQPDRRDQQGAAFDGGVNEKPTARFGQDEPKSDEITDKNRYATIDNGQKRVLNTTDQNK